MKKNALIMSHPGHELRIFRFLELYRPRVYVFTDGSGWTNHSRLPSTERILKEAKCEISPVFGRFTDKEIYELILEKKMEPFYQLMDEMIADMEEHSIDTIVGDACEGFVSSHDLCRYMIDAMTSVLQISNYDFLLEGSPTACPAEVKNEALWIHLSKEELKRKIDAGKNYIELKHEVEKALSAYGEEAFSVECVRPVSKLHVYKTWDSASPGYEHKEEKMEAGLFSELITFEDHLQPMGKLLTEYVNSPALV